MTKKILVKCYLKNNLGDDLFLLILAQRYPDTNFEVFVDPEFKKAYNNISNVKVITKGIFFRAINRFTKIFLKGGIYSLLSYRYHAIVEIGGSIFPERPEHSGVDLERKYLASKFEHYFVIGSNFGPFHSNDFFESYHDFFNQIEGSVFRDKKTFSLFSDLGNVEYAPDVVFTMKPVENIITHMVLSKRKYVAVSVIDLSMTDASRDEGLSSLALEYEAVVKQALMKLIVQKYAIKFVPFSNNQNDFVISKKIATQVKSVFPEADIEILNTTDNMKKVECIKNSSLLISTRYHSMILGWLFGIKQWVLSYSDKTEQVVQDIFKEQYYTNLLILSNEKVEFDENKMNTIDDVTPISKIAEKQFYFLDRYMKLHGKG
ncbi:hypothetical protein C5Z25_10885 [Lactobacillus sp. CBA3605]|uniref:polysaccharide pyruvyl transferase family protein n=1 Tax=Lactobacillus sp. CBA3605 TaxID=2099788 RepID=UPI000CFAD8A9|nr:polysaccharide pyruvyl transferase family protein [Lactobacillus sp. CBA3605]AVK62246.1 hypothetical protein C5Z25_10885 [Lactobacillus sp. CBA3605]